MDITRITKNELHAQNQALRAECDALRGEVSRLKVQLEAERSIGRNNVRGATAFKSLMAELRDRTARGEKVKLVGNAIVEG